MSGDDIDIVERLRQSTGFKVHHTDDGPVITADVELLSEAADEIERLRAERDALRFDNAELLDGLERKHDYACRMDALAEERLMQATRLRTAGQQLLAALTAHDPHHPDCSCHRAHGTCDCGVHDACNEWEQEASRG